MFPPSPSIGAAIVALFRLQRFRITVSLIPNMDEGPVSSDFSEDFESAGICTCNLLGLRSSATDDPCLAARQHEVEAHPSNVLTAEQCPP
jgi:hypothetical protein